MQEDSKYCQTHLSCKHKNLINKINQNKTTLVPNMAGPVL